jgi:hypothetical protein
VRADVPAHEATPTPATVVETTPRWFGVTPPTVLFGVAAVALTLGVVLLVTGALIAGLLLLGLSLLLMAAFLEVARRKPDTIAVRRAMRAADSFRGRAGFAAQALRTRSTARRAITYRRAEAMRLDAERDRLLRSLGEAVLRGEDESELRGQIAALDARRAELESEAAAIARAAEQEVERASRAVQPTEVRPPEGG